MDFVRAETLSGQKELKAEMAMSRSENRAVVRMVLSWVHELRWSHGDFSALVSRAGRGV